MRCTSAYAAERWLSARDGLKAMQVFATSLQRGLEPRQAAAMSDRWMGVMAVSGDDDNNSDFRRFEVRSSSARGLFVVLDGDRMWPGQGY
jgi:hypothetical protein